MFDDVQKQVNQKEGKGYENESEDELLVLIVLKVNLFINFGFLLSFNAKACLIFILQKLKIQKDHFVFHFGRIFNYNFVLLDFVFFNFYFAFMDVESNQVRLFFHYLNLENSFVLERHKVITVIVNFILLKHDYVVVFDER